MGSIGNFVGALVDYLFKRAKRSKFRKNGDPTVLLVFKGLLKFSYVGFSYLTPRKSLDRL